MKNRFAPAFLCLIFFPFSTFGDKTFEKWDCESKSDGLPQILSVEIVDGKLNKIDYTSMAPSADESTFYSCYVEAKRGSDDSEWSEKKGKIVIKLKNSVVPEDYLTVSVQKDSFKIDLSVSPQNCGSSTPLASTISISKAKKECFGIEFEG